MEPNALYDSARQIEEEWHDRRDRILEVIRRFKSVKTPDGARAVIDWNYSLFLAKSDKLWLTMQIEFGFDVRRNEFVSPPDEVHLRDRAWLFRLFDTFGHYLAAQCCCAVMEECMGVSPGEQGSSIETCA